jgi:hypothetical protein
LYYSGKERDAAAGAMYGDIITYKLLLLLLLLRVLPLSSEARTLLLFSCILHIHTHTEHQNNSRLISIIYVCLLTILTCYPSLDPILLPPLIVIEDKSPNQELTFATLLLLLSYLMNVLILTLRTVLPTRTELPDNNLTLG